MRKALLKEYATPYEGAAVKSVYLSEVSTLLRRGPRTIRWEESAIEKLLPTSPANDMEGQLWKDLEQRLA